MSVTETGSSTRSAPSLVFRQWQYTFFLLIGTEPIKCVFSNLASVYNLVSRGKDSVTSCVPGTMVIQMKKKSVDIKVLLHQNIQCINILAQAPDTQVVKFVCMTMSRTKIIYNPFYNC